MIILINQANYLIDNLVFSLKEKHIENTNFFELRNTRIVTLSLPAGRQACRRVDRLV